jgi:hypothetical protein
MIPLGKARVRPKTATGPRVKPKESPYHSFNRTKKGGHMGPPLHCVCDEPQRIVGITYSAPARMPVGHLLVTIFCFV